MKETLAVILILSLLNASLALKETYAQTTNLNSVYTIHWSIVDEEIHLALEVKTTGWVGFGIAEPTSGSMPGADIVTGHVDDTGAHIVDRFATQKALPVADDCQSWALVHGEESNGVTTLELRRKLDTNDTQDRPIRSGPTKIVFAWGTTDNFGYHGENRQALTIIFFGTDPSNWDWKTPDLTSETLSMGNYTAMPSASTNYVCRTFFLDMDQNTDYHLVGIEPIIDPRNIPYVHHFAVLVCNANDSWIWGHRDATFCYNPSSSANCRESLWGWGPGTGPLVMPPQAGFRMGKNGYNIVLVQLHYDNPILPGPIPDDSGIKVYYTTELRDNDVGILSIAEPIARGPPIPPRQDNYELEFECPSECTTGFTNDLITFGDFSHMHKIGKRIFTSIHRNGEFIGYTNRIDFYDFYFQQTTPTHGLVLKPGDRLNTHCIFDSSSRENDTTFGFGSDQEMCQVWIYYYPKVSISYCGYAKTATGNDTMCGTTSGRLGRINPTTRDPPGLATITYGLPFSGPCQVPEVPEDDKSTGSIVSLSLAVIAIVAAVLTL